MDKPRIDNKPLLEHDDKSNGETCSDKILPYLEDDETESKCCCCCTNAANQFYSGQLLRTFRRWFIKDNKHNCAVDIILGLFAGNSGSIKDLKKCRINPDEKSNTRNDLEFYIPQLCGYLIDETKPEELREQLFVVLTQAANACFYFSHRLYFFLQAYTNDTGLSDHILSVMKCLIKVIADQSLYNEDEVLYVSKSKKLIKCLKDLDLDVLYDPILNAGKESKLETIGRAQSERLTRAKNIMIAYILQEEKFYGPQMREVVLEGIPEFKLNARDLVIYPFLGTLRSPCKEESKDSFQTMLTKEIIPENIDEDIRKSAYMSTPSFIKYLTDISKTIMSSDDKLETLRNELRQLNLKLPATVYIPFVTDQIRNHIVLYIPPKEAKVFVTKTKAPYLVAIELYDPLEIVNEPLVLEPYQSMEYLPTPSIPESLKKKRTLNKIMPTQDILVLGTVPRNLVDLKLIEKKRQRKSYEEDDAITIAKSKKNAVIKVNIKDGTVAKCKEEEKMMADAVPLKKRQSAIFPISTLEEKPTAAESTSIALATPARHLRKKPLEVHSSVKPLEFSIDPVLVVQEDVVLFWYTSRNRS